MITVDQLSSILDEFVWPAYEVGAEDNIITLYDKDGFLVGTIDLDSGEYEEFND